MGCHWKVLGKIITLLASYFKKIILTPVRVEIGRSARSTSTAIVQARDDCLDQRSVHFFFKGQIVMFLACGHIRISIATIKNDDEPKSRLSNAMPMNRETEGWQAELVTQPWERWLLRRGHARGMNVAWGNNASYCCLAGDPCVWKGCTGDGNKESLGSFSDKEVKGTSDKTPRKNSLAFRGTAWKELVRKRSEGLQQIYSKNSMKIRVLVVTDGLGVLIHLWLK